MKRGADRLLSKPSPVTHSTNAILRSWFIYPHLVASTTSESTTTTTSRRTSSGKSPAPSTVAVASVMKGAHIVRVHDVKETVEAVRIADAIGV